MNILTNLFGSSLGKKYLMASTGLMLLLFVTGHLIGNLQFFLGSEAINAYGHSLHTTPGILWPARIGLLVLVALHVWSAITLSIENKSARPVAYLNNPSPLAASYASRTMLASGLIIASFIVFHLLHYTAQVRVVNLTGSDFRTLLDVQGRHDVFAMMVTGFSKPIVSGFYVLAVGLLSLHLSHGIGALFQSLGVKSKAWGLLIDRAGVVCAWAIFLGYVSIPAAVLLGYGR